MMLKSGVNPLGMKTETLLAAIVANEVYALHGHSLVITSITDGKHGVGSYHGLGWAIDTRTRHLTDLETETIADEISERLGQFYDVVIEIDHIHIEFDAKRASCPS
ncbi:MAG: hypothetical protein COB36_10605 [Alphaproteobacteria bacterium]|nr:MAG: hypothetical protein COB36_10605 [Alphaproteobacteria bacterium]